MDSSDEHTNFTIPERLSLSGAERIAPAPEAAGAEPAGTNEDRHLKAMDRLEPPEVVASEGAPTSDSALQRQTSSGLPDVTDGELSARSSKESVNQQEVATPVSLKKIDASRRNGNKSNGPKTAEGRQRSSWNSTKHGLLGKRLLMSTGARESEWEHLLESLRQDVEPVGALEELLVEKIAKSYWRLQMADEYEITMARSAGDFFLTMDKMARYQTAIGRQLARDVADLKRLQGERKESAIPMIDGAAEEDGNGG